MWSQWSTSCGPVRDASHWTVFKIKDTRKVADGYKGEIPRLDGARRKPVPPAGMYAKDEVKNGIAG